MDASYLLDLAGFFLRWLHVITAIAWIGASFYFVMLDNSLTPPSHRDLQDKGVDGEMWAVHGGGFYHSNKYMVAPRWLPLPARLHWSYWESYSTWLSGFALFTVLYLFNARNFLIDRAVFDWTPAAAVASALGFLVAFWLLYDTICRTLGQGPRGDAVVGACVAALVVAAAWLACQLFAGRAAFLLVGAMMATAMSANVFVWIIPGQRKVVAALRAGQQPDPVHGRRGKQRSVHNTYFTLPVLVAMISNHYGWIYQAPHAWAALVLLMGASALVRHSFVARHRAHAQGRPASWRHAALGTAFLVVFCVWLAPPPRATAAPQLAGTSPAGAEVPVRFAAVQGVVTQRCVPCHNAQVANKGIELHTPELLARNSQAVYQQAVVLKLMPMNNATGITDDERELIRRWYEAGAALH
ncbi:MULTISPECIES: urate hydroxylase PuuD [Ramlibacter]|uniref:Urate hydroxylase PuuD n=1 Tax=Ramlibacter aquaticus TaxID=2780094 RepID=A0ABR9SCM8_9BURK|nr:MULTISPECIES: urate hydroxylase PuuD [Ramlibacter]MBE7939512.1 urate hydroxylase PuuD [Ramlibacter aquaticus]